MIKVEFDSNLFFSSKSNWYQYRDRTFFKDIEQIKNYQKNSLTKLLKHFKVKSFDELQPITKLPPWNKNVLSINLRRSGTSDSRWDQREYRYTVPQYQIIEDHHIWRIELAHNLTTPGNVVTFGYHHHPHDQPKKIQKQCTIYGSYHSPPIGSHNYHFFCLFDEYMSAEQWRKNIQCVLSLRPKFVVLSPSILEILHLYVDDVFKFPAITTGETFYGKNDLFETLIDKMRCWDGGMSWYTCSHQRKHINDELAILECEGNSNVLLSTDINNWTMPFLKYKNGDIGVIKYGLCDCGIYSSYFESFFGKQIESLYLNGKRVPGTLIYQHIASLFRTGRLFSSSTPIDLQKYSKILWKISQDKNEIVTFSYFCDEYLNEEELLKLLNKILYKTNNSTLIKIQKVDKKVFLSRDNSRTKSLSITSEIK